VSQAEVPGRSRWARRGPRLGRGQPNVPLGGRGLLTLSPRFWILLVLTGVAAGVGGAVLTLILHAVQHLSFDYSEGAFLYGVQRASYARRVIVVTLAGVVVALAGWLFLRILPNEASGVSEVLWLDDRRMGLRQTMASGLVQVVTVAMGSSLGREAAPKEFGAAVGFRLSERVGLPAEQRRVLVAAGAGAGMAGVYNVPLGGALFAAEVLLGSIALSALLPVLIAAVIATVVAWVYIPQEPIYVIPHWHGTSSLLVWALLFGPIAGVAAAAFVRAVAWAKLHRASKGWQRTAVAVPVFAALGVLSIAYPHVLGNGKGPTQLAFDGSGSLALLAALVLLKPLATVACLRVGAVGGLFTPTLATGALLGAAAGRLWTDVTPGKVGLGAFAVVGGAALLAAGTQGPLSAMVLVFELTHADESLLPACLVAVIGAVVVARWADQRSIYTAAFARDSEPHES
jgi:chloride channel protein, CIC family